MCAESKPMSKVLVVDDDRESRDLLREVLEENGYAVDAVEDAPSAREALSRGGDYRIVVADLQMPKESGLDLLRNLRRQNSKYEFILMSSFISATDRRMARELGVRTLLDKPFRISDLLQALAELAVKKQIESSA